MKLPALALATVLALPAIAQTNAPPVDNFTIVTNLWYQGYKTNVLQIAEQRLAVNSNDLAGLVLKMEYDFEFINTTSISNDVLSVIATTMRTTNANIAAHRIEIRDDLQDFLSFLENDYRPSATEIEGDKAKANIIHQRMTYEDYLKWLHDDGLF